MKIVMVGLYGLDTQKAYFRKIGDGCFDFANDSEFGSELTQEEADKVLKYKDWYLKMYNAKEMRII